MKEQQAFAAAIEAAGGQTSLARKISAEMSKSITQMQIWNWLNRSGGRVPPEYVISIEKVTGVSRHDLRPDIYPIEEAK